MIPEPAIVCRADGPGLVGVVHTLEQACCMFANAHPNTVPLVLCVAVPHARYCDTLMAAEDFFRFAI